MGIQDDQLARLTNDLTNMINDLDTYIKRNKQRQRELNNNDNNNKNDKNDKNDKKNIYFQFHYIKSKDGTDRIMCVHVAGPEHNPIHRDKVNKKNKNRLADRPIHKKLINGKVMAPWGDKWLPVCDGSGFPYVQGCYSDASNWSSGSRQCIIENPATPNLANGSLYTCGFLW